MPLSSSTISTILSNSNPTAFELQLVLEATETKVLDLGRTQDLPSALFGQLFYLHEEAKRQILSGRFIKGYEVLREFWEVAEPKPEPGPEWRAFEVPMDDLPPEPTAKKAAKRHKSTKSPRRTS